MLKPGGAAKLVKTVVDVSKNNPHGAKAGDNLLKTAETITGLINTVLLPIAAINFKAKQAEEYFSKRFGMELGEKLKDIPVEHLVAPKASLSAFTLQGLAFSHDEDQLREMYLNLLATAMDDRTEASAHPAFVEVIRQLSSEEARLLTVALQGDYIIPVVEVRLSDKVGYDVIDTHLCNLHVETGAPFNPNTSLFIDNWVRLGLFVGYDGQTVNSDIEPGGDAYSWVRKHPGFLDYKSKFETDLRKISIERGLIQRTKFGELFGKVVGIATKAAITEKTET